jgi:hypothetical protein
VQTINGGGGMGAAVLQGAGYDLGSAAMGVGGVNVNYIPPGLEPYFKDPFMYNVIFASVGAGVVATASVQIQNDSFFVCTQQMAEIWDAATGNTTNTDPKVAPMTVRIIDTSSGKFQMDQPTPIANSFGTAQLPKVWLYRAKTYMPGGQLTVEITNGMAAAQRIRLTFEGFKVFKVMDQLNIMT